MESIFKEIKTAILTNVPEIKWIDLDEGQLDSFEAPPIDYPCLLVEFPKARYSNIADGGQMADVTVIVKLVFKIWEKFNAAVPIANQPGAFAHFDIIRKVVRYLHGLDGDNRSELMRVSYNKSAKPDPKVYEIAFECEYYDGDTMTEYESGEKPDLEITEE